VIWGDRERFWEGSFVHEKDGQIQMLVVIISGIDKKPPTFCTPPANKPLQKTPFMSKIQFDRILPLFTDKTSTTGVQGLLRDILCLQDKLNHLSQQDFYFQKGQESQQQKLNSMKAEYDQMVETANGNEVDFFLEGIIEAETNINHYHTRACTLPIFAKIILEAQALSRISRYRDAIEAKGLFGTLKPLEEVMEDEAALLSIFSAK
jgi:hypothetical protein